MKKALLIVSLLGLLGLVASCQKDKLEDPILKLSSESEIKVEHGATELTIGVETNQAEWLAVSNRDWLVAQPAGNNLLLNVKANSALSSREGTIVITAGGLTRSIHFEQAGQNTFNLDLGGGAQQISIEQEGGEMRLVIKLREDSWSASTSDSWLEVFARPNVGELVLRADANETTKTRIGHIEIVAGKATVSIEVRQKGVLHFLLPYSLWGKDFADIETLESERGSRLSGIPLPNANPAVPYYSFSSPSSAFGTITYEFMDFETDTLYATTLLSEDPDLVYSEDFLAFLVEEGYTRVSPADKTSGLIQYRNTEQKINLYIYTQTTNNVKHGIVYLYPIHEQPRPQATLDDFSAGMIDFGKGKEDAIREWEAKHDGQFDESFSSPGLLFFFVPDPYYARGYFVNAETGVYDETLHFFGDYTLGAYLYGKISYPTKEWNALMESKGFVYAYFNPINRSHVYSNDKDGLNASMNAFRLGPRTLLRVNVWAKAPATNSVSGEDIEPMLLSHRAHQIAQ